MTSADNLNESNRSVYDTCDPDYLRQLRAASGVEETWLARTACLSVAQVRQLEEGGESLFYSPTIKRQAYKRLLMILGAEPPTVVVDIVEQPVPSVVNDLNEIIAMGEKRLNDDHAVAEFFQMLRHRISQHKISAGIVLALSGAGAISFLVPISNTEKKNTAELVMTKTSDVVAVVTPIAPVVAPPPAAVASLPASTHAPLPITSASAPAAAAVGAFACQYTAESLPQLVPMTATKPSRYVHLVANTDVNVCVVDANRQTSWVQLKAGESQSVFGSAPWQVSSTKLGKVQVYFQGWRVALPEGADQRIALIEKTN
jgi:cytoskeleton protein RodZ